MPGWRSSCDATASGCRSWGGSTGSDRQLQRESGLLAWLGGGTAAAQSRVVSPPAGEPVVPEIGVDYVGSVANAATVIAALHHGEKRLAFCESRSQTEDLAQELCLAQAFGSTGGSIR